MLWGKCPTTQAIYSFYAEKKPISVIEWIHPHSFLRDCGQSVARLARNPSFLSPGWGSFDQQKTSATESCKGGNAAFRGRSHSLPASSLALSKLPVSIHWSCFNHYRQARTWEIVCEHLVAGPIASFAPSLLVSQVHLVAWPSLRAPPAGINLLLGQHGRRRPVSTFLQSLHCPWAQTTQRCS